MSFLSIAEFHTILFRNRLLNMLSPEARRGPNCKVRVQECSPTPQGCRQSRASDQQCYFNYCKSFMAAKSSLAFLLLTGNLAGQWLCFKWKSVGFDSLRGALPAEVDTGGPMRYWIYFPGSRGARETSGGPGRVPLLCTVHPLHSPSPSFCPEDLVSLRQVVKAGKASGTD